MELLEKKTATLKFNFEKDRRGWYRSGPNHPTRFCGTPPKKNGAGPPPKDNNRMNHYGCATGSLAFSPPPPPNTQGEQHCTTQSIGCLQSGGTPPQHTVKSVGSRTSQVATVHQF